MATVEITIPSAGESVTQVTLGEWKKSAGEYVEKDEIITEIETDKATMEIIAPASGTLAITQPPGTELEVGAIIGAVDTAAVRPASSGAGTGGGANQSAPATSPSISANQADAKATSVAKKIATDRGIDLGGLKGTGPSGRITKSDVLAAEEDRSSTPTTTSGEKTPAKKPEGSSTSAPRVIPGSRAAHREKMTKLRQRIAERLVSAQHTAAMLTTFNECDMSEAMRLRSAFKEAFEKKHGIGLGFMSFFVRACCSALQAYPRVNAYIVGDEIEYHDYCDVSVAVGTDKGLVVPVVRSAEAMSFAEIEREIKNLALKARDGKLTVDEMTGGTFTISNGGVYGSLMSTPILNPPQSAILGMHTIKKRPIEDPNNPGAIVLRPMMYLALSYDHRIIDGSEAVSFLVHVKNAIENPERLLFDL